MQDSLLDRACNGFREQRVLAGECSKWSLTPPRPRERAESVPRESVRDVASGGQNSGLRGGHGRRPTLYATGRSTHGLYAFLSNSLLLTEKRHELTGRVGMGATLRPKREVARTRA